MGDLWRGDLSVRRLSVLIAHLPPDSATWAAHHGIPEGWALTDYLLADVYHALTGEEHPARPTRPRTSAHPQAADLLARLREQRERLAASRSDP